MIEQEDWKILHEVFVSKEECNKDRDEIKKSINENQRNIVHILSSQKVNNYLTTGIVGGIIALLIKVYLGG